MIKREMLSPIICYGSTYQVPKFYTLSVVKHGSHNAFIK